MAQLADTLPVRPAFGEGIDRPLESDVATPRVMLVGAAFVAFSFLAREQPGNGNVLVKADGLVRTVSVPPSAQQQVTPTGRPRFAPALGPFCLMAQVFWRAGFGE